MGHRDTLRVTVEVKIKRRRRPLGTYAAQGRRLVLIASLKLISITMYDISTRRFAI